MTNDAIATMLTHLRNANTIKHDSTDSPFNKININILKILKEEGYIKDYSIKNPFIPAKKKIRIYLKYTGWWGRKPTFSILKRISKPGRRIFSSYKNFQCGIDFLNYNQGIAVISTSLGVISHVRALSLKLGGEILCYIE